MAKKTIPPAYVGFGMLTPVYIMSLDRLPQANTGLKKFSAQANVPYDPKSEKLRV